MIAVGSDLKALFAFGTNAMQHHELLHPGLAYRKTALSEERQTRGQP